MDEQNYIIRDGHSPEGSLGSSERAPIPSDKVSEFLARTKELQDRFQQMRQPGGLPADKAFFDSLSGDI